MKTIIHRIASVITLLALILSLIGNAIPVAFAASEDYSCGTYEECIDGGELYIITKDKCPIRREAHNDGDVVTRGTKGALVSVKRVFWTKKLAKWCELNIPGSDEPLYIYSENLEKHTSHEFVRVLTSDNGHIEFCGVCGVAKAVADNTAATCDLACVAENFALGSFSEADPTFVGLVAQIVSGEVLGGIADVRDLIGDILQGENAFTITMDAVAILPVIGMVKYADEIVLLGRNADNIADFAKHADALADLSRFDAGVKSNSTELGKNMIRRFAETGDPRFNKTFLHEDGSRVTAAHHIVPGGSTNAHAINSRGLLGYLGIDINSAENGVFLCMTNNQCAGGVIHSGRHSDEYYELVDNRLMKALKNVQIASGESVDVIKANQRGAVINELNQIAHDLMNGKDFGL